MVRRGRSTGQNLLQQAEWGLPAHGQPRRSRVQALGLHDAGVTEPTAASTIRPCFSSCDSAQAPVGLAVLSESWSTAGLRTGVCEPCSEAAQHESLWSRREGHAQHGPWIRGFGSIFPHLPFAGQGSGFLGRPFLQEENCFQNNSVWEAVSNLSAFTRSLRGFAALEIHQGRDQGLSTLAPSAALQVWGPRRVSPRLGLSSSSELLPATPASKSEESRGVTLMSPAASAPKNGVQGSPTPAALP